MSVSIIIKTLNEQARLGQTLVTAVQGLARLKDKSQAYPLGEIIVADSGSTDRTLEIAAEHGARIAQVKPPATGSCGVGPQLGFQYSKYEFVCLMDGDMELDPEFLVEAVAYLNDHPACAGVTGRVVECNLENLEFQRRVQRSSPENRIGDIDRMNGGGLYRRQAVEELGYLSDRNLNGYEEFDLGVRLRKRGWNLNRLDRPFVQHFGHTENAYKLLFRRWRSRYLFGLGQALRASLAEGHFSIFLQELPELRLWFVVYAWWFTAAALFFILPGLIYPLLVNLLTIALLISVMSLRKSSLRMGVYTVVAWLFNAAGLAAGFVKPRLDPKSWIESKKWEPGEYG